MLLDAVSGSLAFIERLDYSMAVPLKDTSRQDENDRYEGAKGLCCSAASMHT